MSILPLCQHYHIITETPKPKDRDTCRTVQDSAAKRAVEAENGLCICGCKREKYSVLTSKHIIFLLSDQIKQLTRKQCS